MSSLAATQADGMYIPPSYLESGAYKKKSISQYAGSKGHNQFLQRNVCRFELPFDGFCTDCNAIVGKGTRFNAHKSHVDDYFTTKIYEFTTRCRACGKTEFIIRTNPKERTFDYISGIRKKVEEFDSAEAGTHGVIDTEFGNGILQYKNGQIHGVDADSNDPTAPASSSSLNLLERNVAGHRKVQTEHEHMESLLALNSWKVDDADVNASVRATFRKDRKAKKRRLGNAAELGLGRGIELARVNDDDVKMAKHTMDMQRRQNHQGSGNNAYQSEKDRFSTVRSGSIFASSQAKSSRKKKGDEIRSEKKEKDTRKDGTSARPKQKIPIQLHHEQKSLSINKKKVAEGKSPEFDVSPEQGALAALSSLYASDSD